jgi:hypothetical protein
MALLNKLQIDVLTVQSITWIALHMMNMIIEAS